VARPNRRNGKTQKTVKGTSGALQIEMPRDRDGSFEPQLVQKRQMRPARMVTSLCSCYGAFVFW
jgi:transposase-like protein